MPYYRCPSCDVISYSAAGYSTVGVCSECSSPLGGGSKGIVPPEPALTRTLPARPGSAVKARRAVEELALPEEAGERLALLATELVTNAVLHAGSSAGDGAASDVRLIELQLTRRAEDVRLAVRDRPSGFTPSETHRKPTLGGLGLMVVAGLSQAWGVEVDGHGSTIWCTLDVPGAA